MPFPLYRTALTAIALGLTLPCALPALAQTTEPVPAAAAASGTVVTGRIAGDAEARYTVAATAGQTLSVDLRSTNPGLNFNILPEGTDTALFIGSTSGTVADIPVPQSGTYVIQVYLMRSAARRDEASDFSLGIGLGSADFADGLSGGPDWWQVAGIDAGSALNVRSGPDTRYDVIGKAQNGEVMQNRGCRMTGATRWCSIRTSGSGVQGWVAGRYLVEGAAPATPETPEGGPVGNGVPFDATGMLDCAMAEGAGMTSCPFGVVRDGPGNAGVWIALGNGAERAILFEGGIPVSADSPAPLSHSKDGDLFTIRVGAETYRFPEAVVNGG